MASYAIPEGFINIVSDHLTTCDGKTYSIDLESHKIIENAT